MSLYKISIRGLLARSLCKLPVRSRGKICVIDIDLCTSSLKEVSWQDLDRSMCNVCVQDLHKRSPGKISVQDLYKRSLGKISL